MQTVDEEMKLYDKMERDEIERYEGKGYKFYAIGETMPACIIKSNLCAYSLSSGYGSGVWVERLISYQPNPLDKGDSNGMVNN